MYSVTCTKNCFLMAFSPPLCTQVAKAVSHSLNNCVNCLPGQKDVDVALKSIGESSKKLLVDSVRNSQMKKGPLEYWAYLGCGQSVLSSTGCPDN